MARILTVSEENAQGPQRQVIEKTKIQYGGVLLGIRQVLLPDLEIGVPMRQIYEHLNLRKGSPLSRLQREMVATVVNGLIGGAP